MKVELDLQLAVPVPDLPEPAVLAAWAAAALRTGGHSADCELTLRLAGEEEIRRLNLSYRHQDRPTNILSFPFECPPGINLPLLGDLVVCYSILEREAREQGKTAREHLAHLIVHGCLHLLGYDHLNPADAAVMEPLEIRALALAGFGNPYAADEY